MNFFVWIQRYWLWNSLTKNWRFQCLWIPLLQIIFRLEILCTSGNSTNSYISLQVENLLALINSRNMTGVTLSWASFVLWTVSEWSSLLQLLKDCIISVFVRSVWPVGSSMILLCSSLDLLRLVTNFTLGLFESGYLFKFELVKSLWE